MVWPFKDTILEGGQTKEEQKRREIFFNETLAKDEVDRLLEPKVLTNFRHYTKNGVKKPAKLSKDSDSTLTDNLIIKGNNLIALHSLKERFAGKVKLIYIDPPYNTGSDSFGYNDNFNHSTWLTFMRNRLVIAKELLKDNGVIFVQIDHHEVGYINLLLDEIFGSENKIQLIAVKVASPSGFKAVNPGPIDVTEFIFFYAKNKKNITFSPNYVQAEYNVNYNLVIENFEDFTKWQFVPIKDKVIQFNGFKSENELKDKFGSQYKSILSSLIVDYAFKNAERVVSIRDLHKPTDKVKELQQKSRDNDKKIYVYKKTDGSNMYIYHGGALAFYKNKIRELDGNMVVTELLSNFWDHISWAGIAKEGDIALKNGKKPEKLLKQLLTMTTKKGDIVLDFFAGSGTTAAVAHKMGRQYIAIEQLDYGTNDLVGRLESVIKGDKKGISKAVKWSGGGSFIYCEMKKYNEKFVQRIYQATSTKILLNIWEDMKKKSFLNYQFDMQKQDKALAEFKALKLEKQQQVLIELLDKNALYVPLSDIEDKEFAVNEEDRLLNKQFYG